MEVLVTGGFGTIGREVVARLLREGHRVRCLELGTRINRRHARKLSTVETIFGDITRPRDIEDAFAGARFDAVIHLAAVLPPLSEIRPDIAYEVNVEGTRNVVTAVEALEEPTLLVLASSVAVMGNRQEVPPPRTSEEEPSPDDHYGRQKLAAEEIVRGSGVPWAILRIGACVNLELAIKQFRAGTTLSQQLKIRADNRVEWVSAGNVATAFANVIVVPEAHRKILFIGGGRHCRASWQELMALFLGAWGLRQVPSEHFGGEVLCVDWMDTEESEKLLHYQTESLGDFYDELRRRLLLPRTLLLPIRPLVDRLLLPR